MGYMIEKFDNPMQTLAALVDVLHQQPYLFREPFTVVVIRLKRYIAANNYILVRDTADKNIVGVATYATLDAHNHWLMQNRITDFVNVKSGSNTWLIDYWWKNLTIKDLIIDTLKNTTQSSSIWVNEDDRELPLHQNLDMLK
jgi:hemolysin-activating ACP:hemolysin acyltransferase